MRQIQFRFEIARYHRHSNGGSIIYRSVTPNVNRNVNKLQPNAYGRTLSFDDDTHTKQCITCVRNINDGAIELNHCIN